MKTLLLLAVLSIWPFPAQKYPLTVINGVGSGVYAAGTKVTIQAVSNEGTFSAWLVADDAVPTMATHWEGKGLADPHGKITTFTMPKHGAAIQAVFIR